MHTLILHAFFTPAGGFTLWGETFSGAERQGKHYPYAAGTAQLREVLALLFKNWVPLPEFKDVSIIADLPVDRANQPLPSRAFLSSHHTTLPPIAGFRRFDLPGLRIEAPPLFLILQTALRTGRLSRTILFGSDLTRLAEIFRFSTARLADGHFIPTLQWQDERPLACWKPALTPPERGRFEALISRLPPVVFPLDEDRTPENRRITAYRLLDFLSDALVRANASTTLTRSHAQKGHFHSAHDAWLAALRNNSPYIRWPMENTPPDQAQADCRQLYDLAQTLERWLSPILESSLGTTLLITLHPPESGMPDWKLSVELPGREPDALLTSSGLTLLGQASLLCPLLVPDRPLTTADAHSFIRTAVPVLRSAGFLVALPPGLEPQTDDSALEMTAEAALADGTQPDTLTPETAITLKWQARINGHPVSQEELQAILDGATPLVYFRGEWITLDLNVVAEMLRRLRHGEEEKTTLGQTLRKTFLSSGIEGGLLRRELTATGMLQGFFATLNGTALPNLPPLPGGLCATLRPYQLRGYAWLSHLQAWGFGACLADDMGLGKTLQTLTYLLARRQQGEAAPVLIIAPLSVLANWQHEIETFTPALRAVIHHGVGRKIGPAFVEQAESTDIVLTDYALAYRDFDSFRRVTWSTLVLDEAQNIKNAATRQSKAARALPAGHRIALTGTPVENTPSDLWSIMDFLNPGLLGDQESFKHHFLLPLLSSNADQAAGRRLRHITAPFILRRLKSDPRVIADLPEKLENRVYCPLTSAQSDAYDTALRAFSTQLPDLEGANRRGRILAVLTRLKQICDHPSLPAITSPHEIPDDFIELPSGKLNRLEDMLREVEASGESALIFTQFARMGALLRARLAETFARDVPFLHGGLSVKARQREIDAFQNAEGSSFFVLSLKAGGLGLNLTKASHVFHFDRWWNPAVENQATDRAYRIGQTKTVFVHTFICRGTLEDRIDALLLSKQNLADSLIDANANSFLTRLPDEELLALLARKEENE